jgi:hypothetical protein
MAMTQQPLFCWTEVEVRSDLDRLRLVMQSLPDADLVHQLERMRGSGRDDFPVRPMWNSLLAGIVFQHPGIETLRRELSRNPALMALCGFEILPVAPKPVSDAVNEAPGVVCEAKVEPRLGVPSATNYSRFLGNLIALDEREGIVAKMIAVLRTRLMEALPDFGTHLGFDGKALASHSTGQIAQDSGQASDPDADWGHHETHGVDKRSGRAWTKVKSWFGYGLHLIADIQYEIPVAFELTPASASESPKLQEMIPALFAASPELAERCADFSADRGLDCGETKAMLWDHYQIRPLIDTRLMWRAEKAEADYDATKPITRPLFADRADTIVYTERGTVHCICPSTQEQREMAFQGFEAERGTLKYRCPAAAYGLNCEGMAQCHRAGEVQPGEYGRVVRIPLAEHDRRIFTPTPHGSPSWHRGYNRRSAMERINNRIDNSFGFEHHFIRGMAKMKTRVGLALAVMMAIALGHVNAGRVEQMRSLVRPIAATG